MTLSLNYIPNQLFCSFINLNVSYHSLFLLEKYYTEKGYKEEKQSSLMTINGYREKAKEYGVELNDKIIDDMIKPYLDKVLD